MLAAEQAAGRQPARQRLRARPRPDRVPRRRPRRGGAPQPSRSGVSLPGRPARPRVLPAQGHARWPTADAVTKCQPGDLACIAHASRRQVQSPVPASRGAAGAPRQPAPARRRTAAAAAAPCQSRCAGPWRSAWRAPVGARRCPHPAHANAWRSTRRGCSTVTDLPGRCQRSPQPQRSQVQRALQVSRPTLLLTQTLPTLRTCRPPQTRRQPG